MGWQRFKKRVQPQVDVIPVNENAEGPNGYIIICNDQAAAIDISGATQTVVKALAKAGAQLEFILVTHAHPSHIQSIPELKACCGGIFCLHPYELDLLHSIMPGLHPDRTLKDNAKLRLGGTIIKVLHTPGHTKGSLCFYLPEADILFGGSTLLKGKHGRIWGPKSMSLMLFSLKRLNYSIYDATVVYPGRGESTTMGNEGWMNCLRSV